MPDPTPPASTQAVSTLPSHVAALTIIAQVVGYLVATFGGLLTYYQATHQGALWVGPAITAAGLLYNAATHYGYVKGQAVTQNAVVNALLATGGPAAAAFLAVIVSKGKLEDALKAGVAALLGQQSPFPLPAPLVLPASALAASQAPSPSSTQGPQVPR